jgi:hydroxymethylpyrimidine/phosphomethylpyrimidine kinase
MREMRTVLTVAGTDPSGGAGLHADLKTFTAHGVYGMGVVTAIVAQNTRGVYAIEKVSPGMVAAQLEAVFDDIVPDAVKIGMVPDADAIAAIARVLRKYRPRLVVIDPVMVSTSGHRLLGAGAESALVAELFPLAALVTPNVPEAEALCGFSVVTRDDMERAGAAIRRFGPGAVLVKGGHLAGSCDDFLSGDSVSRWYRAPRVDTKNTHGTGCTLSAAIAANLAGGSNLDEAVERGKAYLFGALSRGLDLGKGSGPVDHCWALESPYPAGS